MPFQKLAEADVTAYAAFQQNFGAGRVDLPCEALTRTLEHRLIATSEFAAACAEAGEPIGQHAIAGFEPAPTLFTYRVEAG